MSKLFLQAACFFLQIVHIGMRFDISTRRDSVLYLFSLANAEAREDTIQQFLRRNFAN